MSYYARTVFLNGEEKVREAGIKACESFKEDMNFYFQNWVFDYYEDPDLFDKYNMGSFFEYGLSFSPVYNDEEELEYYKYCISTGGPGTEVRFYQYETHFVYLDWFVGVGFSVNYDDVFKDLRQYFDSCEMLDFSHEKVYEFVL